jgi:tetratricopeptide (TPR) repeat protein
MQKISNADTFFDQGEYQKAQAEYQSVLKEIAPQNINQPTDPLKTLIEKALICAFLLDQADEISKLSMLLLEGNAKGLAFAVASMHYLKEKQVQKQPAIQINEIKIALKEGRFYHALDLITQAQNTQLEPKILLDYLKGKTLFSIGKYEEAVILFQKAYQQMPHPYLMMELINGAMANRQNQLAQQYLEDYLAVAKNQNAENPSRFYLQAKQYLDQLKAGQ